MYQFSSRVRYSEVNSEKILTLPALLDYLQDCCIFQSEELGVGVDYLADNHAAWVLSSWQIRICRYPKLGEEITVSTWAYDFKGFYGCRSFKVEGEDKGLLAYANSLWVFMDTDTMRPMRINQKMIDVYLPQMAEIIGTDWGGQEASSAGRWNCRGTYPGAEMPH